MSAEAATKGWIVPVWTERLGGGRPLLVAYVTLAATSEEARQAVVDAIQALEGDDVRDPVAISEATVAALGLSPGQVSML